MLQRTKSRSPAHLHLPLALLAIVVLGATLFAACGGGSSGSGLDEGCLAAGRCECRVTSECPGGLACVDGRCVRLNTGLADAEVADFQIDFGGEGPPADVRGEADLPDSEAPPGTFGAPCGENEDCASLICVLTTSGGRCSQRCVGSCPGGWDCRGQEGASGELVFVCLPGGSRLCEPCLTDLGCGGTQNLCLATPDGNFCGLDCTLTPCPEGYVCNAVTSVDGASGQNCQPIGGACDCTPEVVGVRRNCSVENAFGSCPGTKVCQADRLWSACDARTPAAEVCDGGDDDCNGIADDGAGGAACTIDNAYGSCPGTEQCLGEAGTVCSARIPAVEVCDGVDNNCDGTVDDPFRDPATGQYAATEHCGACGATCEGLFANATGARCDTSGADPRCVVTDCLPGFFRISDTLCAPVSSHLCEPCTGDASCLGPADLCLALDPTDPRRFCGRDCSETSVHGSACPTGYVCRPWDGGTFQCIPENGSCDCGPEVAGRTKPCRIENEFGTCFGIATCDPAAGWVGCTAATPLGEVCDGQDQNCNGLIDEGLNAGAPCQFENEFGTCQGVFVCQVPLGMVCTAGVAEPELCDGLDNNCDGQIDELWAENVFDAEGRLVNVNYALSDDDCGGCGVPCRLGAPPATAVGCDGTSGQGRCLIQACEPGYYVFEGTACLPLPSGQTCQPCTADADCLGPNDRCLPQQGGGQFCGRDCAPGAIYDLSAEGGAACTGIPGTQGCCPADYLCRTLADPADPDLTVQQCLPASGSCDCTEDGRIRLCANENAFGRCRGVQTCTLGGANPGWTDCSAATPAPEVCNGRDDDCDGLVDQSDPDVDVTRLPAEPPYPACQNVSAACAGAWSCTQLEPGQYDWVCNAPSPRVETCNGRDDDCDGAVDEDFTDAQGQFTRLDHCGACGFNCEVTVAHLARDAAGDVLDRAVRCEAVDGAPRCVVDQCEEGYYPYPAGPAPALCLRAQAVACQPCSSDADCLTPGDRCLPVGADDGQFCATDCAADSLHAGCTGAVGTQDCCPDGFTCTARAGAQLCQPDTGSCQCSAENAGLVRPCYLTSPDGSATCFGVEACAEATPGVYGWAACDASDTTVEICDGNDNDCDGQADEGFTDASGRYTADEHCGQCGRNCLLEWNAAVHHAAGTCAASGPSPACALDRCLTGSLPGGGACRHDGECTAPFVCLPGFNHCGLTCTADGQCGAGGVCRDNYCTRTCTADAQCTVVFGPQSVCEGGSCRVPFQFVDLDGLAGNGCECPADGGTDEPEVFANYPEPGFAYPDRNCDGVDGDAATALFVRAGATGGNGSRTAPFGTIAQALAAYQPATHSGIFVAAGTYAENVTLTSGVRLFGGYSTDFLSRDIVAYPSLILGQQPDFSQPNPRRGVVFAENVTATRTVLAGFHIYGYDVTYQPPVSEAGRNAYGIYVKNSNANLVLRNNVVYAGAGGPGGRGADGATGNPGGAGGAGLNSRECAGPTCAGETNPGGAAGTNGSCGAAAGTAGGTCYGNRLSAVVPGQQQDFTGGGLNGEGGWNSAYNQGSSEQCKYDCTVQTGYHLDGWPAENGGNGSAGSGGTGCAAPTGGLVGEEWRGTTPAGGTGGAGSGGTGGGGGGAGGGVYNTKAGCTQGNYRGDVGGSGGGGGAGGCGGAGGSPGAPGGASFAIFVYFASQPAARPDIGANLIYRGDGGPAGAGGQGGLGGLGGAGGAGGLLVLPAWCGGRGGPGGRGGTGGPGGGGGGGCGGVSFGIAGTFLSGSGYDAGNVFYPAASTDTGGPGGGGGIGPGTAGDGTAGARGAFGSLRSF